MELSFFETWFGLKKSDSSFILRNKNPDSSIVNPGLVKKVHVNQCFPTRFPETSFCTLGDNVSRDSGNNFGRFLVLV